MRLFTILTGIIFSFLFFTACKKMISKKISGNYSFVTHALAYNGGGSNDTTITFAGYIRQESKHSVEIKYAPHIGNANYPGQIFVDGTIHPGINDDATFSYPDYVAQDYHYYFSGHVSDDGTIRIKLEYDGLGAGYYNEITGTRR